MAEAKSWGRISCDVWDRGWYFGWAGAHRQTNRKVKNEGHSVCILVFCCLIISGHQCPSPAYGPRATPSGKEISRAVYTCSFRVSSQVFNSSFNSRWRTKFEPDHLWHWIHTVRSRRPCNFPNVFIQTLVKWALIVLYKREKKSVCTI